MKKSIAILLFTVVAANSAFAEEAAIADNSGTKKELNTMINSLSNILSATNPKPVQPALSPAERQAEYQRSVTTLPPLVAFAPGAELTATEALKTQPMVLPQPMESVAKLSPETKRILRSSPSNIGAREVYKKESLTLQRGGFDPEFGSLYDGPIDWNENTEPEPVGVKPKFEIEVKNIKNPTTTAALLNKALAALQLGQYEAAIVSYKEALTRDKKSRDALFGLATAYHKAGQKSQAKAAYAKLLAAYPTFQAGFNNLLVLASEEAPQDALMELNNLSSRNPNFAAIYAQKAVVYNQLGETAKVKENYLKALSIEPDNLFYKYNLAVFLDSSGDIATAIALYQQLLEQGYQGANLPVPKQQIIERIAYIGGNPKS